MRTKILKYFGMVVVLIIMVNLTSCEVSIESWYDDDDYSEIYYRTTRELCSRTWQETWEQDGEYYTQRLDFYENRTGTDIIQIEHRNGYVTEDRYNFEWRWDNSAQTCIRMVYGPSDISYFERHYKIFCVNGNTGFRNESRIFYFIHLQNEEAYERKESSSA